MNPQKQLIDVFQDTMSYINADAFLRESVARSISETQLYLEDDCPVVQGNGSYDHMCIQVTRHRTFEAARLLHTQYPGKRIAVHNFASATNPGGGVTRGSRAQEESLCRCSTLYPVLNTSELIQKYYQYHRDRHDVLYTDACIYSPGIQVVKSDTDLPQRLPKDEWVEVDVLTCAAPNLRPVPYNRMNPGRGEPVSIGDGELTALHRKRARHMLSIAAARRVDILVLGAFGCGAFRNPPDIVVQAYKDVLPEFDGRFLCVEFAVYCPPGDSSNYDAFSRALSPKQ